MTRRRLQVSPGLVPALACSVTFLESSLFGALTPLLPAFAGTLDISKAGAGLLAAAFPLGTFVAAVPSILVARRVGYRRTVVLSLVVLGVASAAFAVADVASALFAARFAQGVGSALAYTGALAWLTSAMPSSRTAEAIGYAFAAAFVGGLIGPLLGALAEAAGRAPVFLTIAALAGGLAAVAQATPGGAGQASAHRALRGLVVPTVAFGVWLIGLAGILVGAVSVLAPLHLDAAGWSAKQIALVFAAASVATAIGSPPVGRLADRYGMSLPIVFGFAAAAACVGLLAIAPSPSTYALLVVLGLTEVGILWAPTMAWLADAVARLRFDPAAAYGMTNAAWAPGFAIGAALSATVGAAAGDQAVYCALLVTSAVTAGVVGLGARQAAVQRR